MISCSVVSVAIQLQPARSAGGPLPSPLALHSHLLQRSWEMHSDTRF